MAAIGQEPSLAKDGLRASLLVKRACVLKRVFDINMQRCPNCGIGEFRLIAANIARSVVDKILTCLGLDP